MDSCDRAGSHHVGIYPMRISLHVHDTATDRFSILELEIARTVLVADFLARIDDRFQQNLRAEFAANRGEVGTDRFAFAIEAIPQY